MQKPVTVSIICPVLNESAYVDTLVKKFLHSDGIGKEVFFLEAGSTDDTKAKLLELQKQHSNIYIVDNPQKYVSFGFNKAFPLTNGKYIAFLGAHADYPDTFFSNAVKYLESGECDAVGGPLKQSGKTDTGKAIAYCMSNKFGVGGTEFRTSTQKQYVQSVAFAVYKKEVFEKAGLLDEELLRNQDDELHYRLNEHGFRILMVPEMQCAYFVRSSISRLFSQYFQYGLFKPLVLKKVRSGVRIRHLIPACFVAYFLSLPIAAIYLWWLVPMALYLFCNFVFSFFNELPLSQKLKAFVVFPMLHISYGSGFILGLLKNPKK
ncbi:MAG: glycosyltransferase family 2 protein [Bacteroidia bacterium]